MPWYDGKEVNYLPLFEERTDEICIPLHGKIEQLDDVALIRGLCHKSGGKIAVCRTCCGCAFGRELTRRRENA